MREETWRTNAAVALQTLYIHDQWHRGGAEEYRLMWSQRLGSRTSSGGAPSLRILLNRFSRSDAGWRSIHITARLAARRRFWGS